MFFVQDFIRPYMSFRNLSSKCFPDLNLPDDVKQFVTQYLVLNCFFDNSKHLLENLGIAYFTVKQYFIHKHPFFIVDDPDGEKRASIISYIRSHFQTLNLCVPLSINQPSDIIQNLNDFFDDTKVINTCIFLVCEFCTIDTNSLVSELEPVTL
jgi:hypothetical protein